MNEKLSSTQLGQQKVALIFVFALTTAASVQITTRATIDGSLGFDLRSMLEEEDLVQQAIQQADVDVPEVTQV